MQSRTWDLPCVPPVGAELWPKWEVVRVSLRILSLPEDAPAPREDRLRLGCEVEESRRAPGARESARADAVDGDARVAQEVDERLEHAIVGVGAGAARAARTERRGSGRHDHEARVRSPDSRLDADDVARDVSQ